MHGLFHDDMGVYFEDKRSTLAIHYGLSRGWRRAKRLVYEAANQLEGTRLIPGKKVLNVLPHDFPSKGDAVRALVAHACASVGPVIPSAPTSAATQGAA